MTPKIQFLTRNQINDAKWDQAMRAAVNTLPYGYTWYLDALCTRWAGIVVGDYDFILPLPVNRKWGLLYVYQPLFCQQLGVFYKRRSDAIVSQMLQLAMKRFIFVNLNGNYDNYQGLLTGLKPKEKTNLIIDLRLTHRELQKNYADNATRNIKKAQKAGLVFEIADPRSYESYVDFYIRHTAVRDRAFKKQHHDMLRKLVHQFIIHNCCKLYVAKTPEGDLCSGAMVVENGNRVIHLMPASNDHARQHGGMQYVMDGVLRHYAESDRVYDFEGSSVATIAQFYKSFGTVAEPFFVLEKAPFKR